MGELPVGGLFVVAGGIFQSAVGGGVTGFALGVAKVGKAFHRAVGEVGRGSQRWGCCWWDDAPGDNRGTNCMGKGEGK